MRNHSETPLYRIRRLDLLVFAAGGGAAGTAVCWLCYNTVYSAPVGAVIAAVFFFLKTKERKKQMKRELLYQFKDFIAALHTSVRAGYSVENGIRSAAEDIKALYGEKNMLYRELRNIIARMQVRIKMEDLFMEFGERSGLDDIKMFAELLSIAKKTGGDLNSMLLSTANILCDKIDTKHEIDSLIASRVFEQKIMSITPAGIIVYLRVSFTGFIENLYGSLFGASIMTVGLIVYMAAFLWGRKITEIEAC